MNNAPRRFALTLLTLSILLIGSTPPGLAQNKPAKPKFEVSEDEQTIIDLTNKEREKAGLKLVKANEKLFKAARGHSENMAKQNIMAHELDGKNPLDRINEVRYAYSRVGENVAWGQKKLERLMEMWMESEHHKANILQKDFTEIGIGIAKNEKGQPYFTQLFGRPRGR